MKFLQNANKFHPFQLEGKKGFWDSIPGRLFSLLSAILILILVTIYRNELLSYANYGYLGIILACFGANSTVFLPAPSATIVLVFSTVYNPFWVAVAGGFGAATGEIVGYLVGFSGRGLRLESEWANKISYWMIRSSTLTMFIFAFLPLPLFDLVGATAGILGIPFIRFFPPVFAGKLLKMLIYAYLGSSMLPIFERFLSQFH